MKKNRKREINRVYQKAYDAYAKEHKNCNRFIHAIFHFDFIQQI